MQSVKADAMKISINTEGHSNVQEVPAVNLDIYEIVLDMNTVNLLITGLQIIFQY